MWPTHVSAVSAWKAWSAARAARRILLDLAVVLDRAQGLDDAASSARARAPSSRASAPASAAARRPRTRCRPSSRSARSSISERFASSALTPGHLLGVEDVAEVGEELRLPAVLDEQRGVRGREAGQVLDVDQVRDEQRARRAARGARRAARSRLLRARRGRRAPRGSRPGPCRSTRCETTSAITDWRRHSSRSSTFERCTSTIGTSRISSASWIA